MANIIDLDFYRKFRVILPLYGAPLENDSFDEQIKSTVRPCRKRRKLTPSSLFGGEDEQPPPL